MTRFRRAAIAGIIIVPLVAGGFLVQEKSARDGARLLDQVLSLVSDRFVDTLDASALYEKAARGLVKELNDPYSELLSPKQREEFSRTTNGRYGGIGMLIEKQDAGVTVSRVFPHTPAENAGIREGDRIVQIDTAATTGWSISQVSNTLLGTPGTKVQVKFARPGVGEPIQVKFTRAEIHIPAVQYSMMLDGRTGYFPLLQFNETAAAELQDALTDLSKQGAKSVVIDLRDNPGGILEQAIDIGDLLLDNGQQIASVRGRGPEQQSSFAARGAAQFKDLQLVLLTDGYTASAAEIVAGALQDHDRALIVGQTSFGKGLVQTVYTLDGGWALKMTTAKWFTPSGRSIQKERKLLPDGRFVEVHPDSMESDSARKARPVFRSDAGRIVYGGGAITPDVVVREDTLTTAEQKLAKAIAPKAPAFFTVLTDYAVALRGTVKPDFTVQPAWRDELYKRMTAAGIDIDRKDYDAGIGFIDRQLEGRVARIAFGDAVAKRHDLVNDAPLRKALALLQEGKSQRDLLARAAVASNSSQR
ncbi:MAG: S41 family peptidase [Gemmatimonadaceae bacterium]|nr:S41 family peptidase [Gemmatimonadaceae bacterium]NUR18852.1 S41 family peptidase [Gemmatimonadaceae bacterium]NUS99303.1 S41 family peptidase [Gemmatimonadaceae bacterium]